MSWLMITENIGCYKVILICTSQVQTGSSSTLSWVLGLSLLFLHLLFSFILLLCRAYHPFVICSPLICRLSRLLHSPPPTSSCPPFPIFCKCTAYVLEEAFTYDYMQGFPEFIRLNDRLWTCRCANSGKRRLPLHVRSYAFKVTAKF